MSAVDVSAITPEVIAQIESVAMVGFSVLAVYWAIKSLKHLRQVIMYGDITPGGDFYADPESEARDLVERAEREEKSLQDQADELKRSFEAWREERAMDVADSFEKSDHDKLALLMARGKTFTDAVEAVEMRNDAVEKRDNRLTMEKEDRKAAEFASYTDDERAMFDRMEAEYQQMWSEQNALR